MNMHEYMDLYLHIYVLIYLNVRSNDVAYMTLYESSIANGIRKALMAHQKISELDAKLRLLTATKVPTYLPTFLPSCLPICLTTCLSACLTARMSSLFSILFACLFLVKLELFCFLPSST